MCWLTDCVLYGVNRIVWTGALTHETDIELSVEQSADSVLNSCIFRILPDIWHCACYSSRGGAAGLADSWTDGGREKHGNQLRVELAIQKTWFSWKPTELFQWLKLFWTHLHKTPKSLMFLRSLWRCVRMLVCACVFRAVGGEVTMNLNGNDKSLCSFN